MHWGVLYIIGKQLKCKCRKWVCMNHLDIHNTSYSKKKGQESNWQFDSQPLKAENRPDPNAYWWNATHLEIFQWELQPCFRLRPNRRFEQIIIVPQSCGSLNRGSFRTPPWESWDKKPFGCGGRGELQRILYGGRWWLPPSLSYGESCESKVACGLS